MFKKISFTDIFKKNEYTHLTKEEQKLYKLTQCNTILNRDMLDRREVYLKNAQSEYKEIYGNKGVKFCENTHKKVKSAPKKKCKVQFSNNIEYSIN